MESLDPLVHTPPAGRAPRALPALVLGRYRPIDRLGAGGFGVVWRARDELLDREVAVKRVPLPPGGEGDRATREALATARLSHPAIVALFEASHEGDSFYLVSELVRGTTLAALISDGSLSDREIVLIGLALTDALDHAHARGVIHRDVKPQNVLVPERTGETDAPAKLTDFGGARLAGEDTLTRTGDVVGTLAYMAPEQAEGREAAEPADLYATALVLYEALAGINPVRGPTPAATARRIGRRLPALRARRGDLPTHLTAALDVALHPQPADRGSVAQLHDALAAALEEVTATRSPRPIAPVAVAPPPRAVVPVGSAHSPRPIAPVAADPTVAEPALGTRLRGALAAAALAAAALSGLGPAPPLQPVAAGALVAVAVGALPRLGWLAASVGVVAWLVGAGRAGTALLVMAAAAPVALLLRRPGAARAAAVLAPALGGVGLAGAFPAVAGQLGGWARRAALGALGYWWLLLGESWLGRGLWLGPAPGVMPRAVWERSLAAAASHALWPLLTAGALLGALLWAIGAALLPWLVRGRSAAIDVVAATMWATALVCTAPLLARLGSHAGAVSPRGAVVGAVASGLFAVVARALRGPV